MIYELENLKPSYLGDSHWIADSADVIGNVQIGLEVSIWWRAVVRGDNEPIVIGDRTNVQDGCVLHTDPGFPIFIGNSPPPEIIPILSIIIASNTSFKIRFYKRNNIFYF